ncbi:MAG TPA: acyltransferase [Thermohalobaculum sp.]|nr:acyltransferase [Thermohalobaculum sp.]
MSRSTLDVVDPTGFGNLKYNSVQFLRFVAVIAVLVFHSHWAVKQKLINVPILTDYGWIGVILFFAVSGFIISERISLERSLGRFLFRRYMRVFPLYGLFTLLAIVLSLGFGWDHLGHERTDSGRAFNPNPVFYYYIKSLFIVPQDAWPAFMVGWSLEYEVVFYLTFGVAYFNGGRKLALFIVLTLALLGGALPNRFGPFFDYNFYYFLSGCIAREVLCYESRFMFSRSSLICLVTSILWISHLSGVFDITVFGFLITSAVSFGALIIACVSLEKSKTAFLHANAFTVIGDMSFSLYLFHWLVVSVCLFITGDTVFSAVGAEFIRIAAIVVSLAGSWAVWTYLEKPINRAVHKSRLLNQNSATSTRKLF